MTPAAPINLGIFAAGAVIGGALLRPGPLTRNRRPAGDDPAPDSRVRQDP
jgi:hypothetical protein